MKKLLHGWVPPRAIRLAHTFLGYCGVAEWEYAGNHWHTLSHAKGWNTTKVAEFQKAGWHSYASALEGTAPLALNHEESDNPTTGKLRDHNALVSYAYVLAFSCYGKKSISILDWGGGVGHYYLISKAVMPGMEWHYYCYDLPLLCRTGRDLEPRIEFLEARGECFGQKYDLVVASSSLWYEEDWRGTLRDLSNAADPFLYVTRMIFVSDVPSFTTVQRTPADSYCTEYLCWIFNQQEFLAEAKAAGLELVREFLIGDAQFIFKAPEQGAYKGFLFRKAPTGNRTRSISREYAL